MMNDLGKVKNNLDKIEINKEKEKLMGSHGALNQPTV